MGVKSCYFSIFFSVSEWALPPCAQLCSFPSWQLVWSASIHLNWPAWMVSFPACFLFPFLKCWLIYSNGDIDMGIRMPLLWGPYALLHIVEWINAHKVYMVLTFPVDLKVIYCKHVCSSFRSGHSEWWQRDVLPSWWDTARPSSPVLNPRYAALCVPQVYHPGTAGVLETQR